MIEHENICRGALGFKPSLNHIKLSKSEYWAEFIKNSAKYNKIDESKVASIAFGKIASEKI